MPSHRDPRIPLLGRALPVLDDPWLPFAPHPGAAGRPLLYCLPPAGGGASMFFRWIKDLADVADVRPVQLPGRESRTHDAPITEVAKLATAVADVVDAEHPGGYHLFGHSFGSLLAFETARVLRRRGVTPPQSLLVSAGSAPGSRSERAGEVRVAVEDADLVAFLRVAEGTPEVVFRAPALLAMVLPVLRADLLTVDGYVYEPEPPLAVPILALGGHRDRLCPPAALEEWAAYTTADFGVRMFDGGHFYLQKAEDFLDALREAVRPRVRPSTP